jgi:phenylalanyl-tRNA synthetase beta chain
LFEIGHTFEVDSSERPKLVENYLESERICLMITGLWNPSHWSIKPRPVDFFDLKGEVTDFLRKIVLDKSRFISYSTTETLDENALGVEINGSYAGHIGSVSEHLLKFYDIRQEVFLAELELSALSLGVRRKYEQLSRFPRVRRDIALVVRAEVPADILERTIWRASTSLLQSVVLFDLYDGDKLPQGTKSLAFALEFMSPDRTLVDTEVEAEMARITKTLEQEFGASLRGT